MVTETGGREAFDYGPMVQDGRRVVALNVEHAVRDVICVVYPNPGHERGPHGMVLS